ncbi:MAG: hypothetical protein ACKV2U_23225 [Bryobacteraceae bacterium]
MASLFESISPLSIMLSPPFAMVGVVALTANGDLLASDSQLCTIKLWDPRSGRLLGTLEDHTVRALALTANGDLLASGSWDNTVKLWDPRSGRLLHTLEGHSSYVHAVELTANGDAGLRVCRQHLEGVGPALRPPSSYAGGSRR